MTNDDGLIRRIATALQDAGIQAMLTGSFAGAVHGRPRATQDVDFVIETDEAHLRAFIRALPAGMYYADEDAAVAALASESQFNLVDHATGWKIDLIIRKSRDFSVEEFGRRQRRRLAGIELDVVSAEDLVIAKLEWAKRGESERQLDDVAAIVAVRGDRFDRAYVERWVARLDLRNQWEAALVRAVE